MVDPLLRQELTRLQDGVEGSVNLRFALFTDRSEEEISAALRSALDGLEAAYDDGRDDGTGHLLLGQQWSVFPLRDHFVVSVLDCGAPTQVVGDVAEALDALGVPVRLAPAHVTPVDPPPDDHAEALITKLRLRGSPEELAPSTVRWRPEPELRDRALDAALSWARETEAGATESISFGAAEWVEATQDASMLRGLYEWAADGAFVGFCAATPTAYRCIGSYADGGLALMHCFRNEARTGWRTALVEMTDVLRQIANALSYAYLYRGWDVSAALIGNHAGADWPSRRRDPHELSYVRPAASQATAAPDAFGVQYLGPSYRGRIPQSDRWIAEPLAGGTLLRARSQDEWFRQPMVPLRTRVAPWDRPVPAHLEAARGDLASILDTARA